LNGRPDIAADGQYLKHQKTYLVTGGAGSLGKEIVDILIKQGHKVRAMDLNESALASMVYPESQFTRVYGDIRSYPRVHYAMMDVDIVIHCAAMKNLDITESNVPEMNLTNVIGTDNIAVAALECGVECAILISTDKAVYPVSAYGASKLLAEQSWLKCYSRQSTKTRFVVFRSGNFKQSAGNVLEVWDRQSKAGQSLTITDPDMERYFVDTRKAAELVCNIPHYADNGAIITPKMDLIKIVDLLKEQFPGCAYKVIGIRSGEKKSERLMTNDEHITHETEEVMVIK
jgi:UDP-N-acetylglucosamine 4,6-dehydratase